MQAVIRKPKPFYAKLHNQVIIAMVAAIVLGAVWPSAAVKMKPLGDGFIKLIGMVIAPLVFCIIVSGISGMGNAGRVARIGAKTLVYFYVVSALALLLGLIAANLIPTGVGLNIDPRSIDTSSIAGYVTTAKDQSVVAFLLNIIPVTFVDAFAKGAILQVVLIAVLFGLALISLGDRARVVKDVVDQLTRVMFSIVEMIIALSAVGAFGAMAFTVGRFGLHTLLPLLKLVLLFYGACLTFVLLVLVPIAWRVGFSVRKFCGYILDEILLFLSISNSEALLPRLMEKLERMGVPKSVVGLVVPTGYSFNLAGSSIYFTLCVIFIAQATNTPLPLDRQLVILLVAMLMSKGATGFTGAGFVVLAGTLAAMPDIPMAGLALLLGIDPFMQRGRGLVNYIGNGVAAIAIAAWDKDLDVAELNRHLDLGSDSDVATDVASDGSMPHSPGGAAAVDAEAASALMSATGEPSATRQL
jgi:aerobic C4-dicarboxylate transport protein